MNPTPASRKNPPAPKARRKIPVGPRCRAARTSRPSPRGGRKNGAAQPRLATLRAEFRAWRASLPTPLERDTLLMPEVIAENVVREVEQFLGEEIPVRYLGWLAAKAERCYAGHRQFHKLMRGRGDAPRDRLHVFMRHWLAGLLGLERPDLLACLPMGFSNGSKLPHGRHPRINRRGFIRDLLPHPRPWDAARVTGNRRWAWLASPGH